MLDDYTGSSEWPVGYTLAWSMNLISDTDDCAWARQSRPLDTGHHGQPCDEGSTTTHFLSRPLHHPTSGEATV